MRYLAIIVALGCYSPASHAFLESLGLSIIGNVINDIITKDQSAYRPADYESPIEETVQESKHVRNCDEYGGCQERVTTTTVRKVREYRYDYQLEWSEWAYQ